MSGGDLLARNISVRFGGINVLSDVTLNVRPGEILGLIGPNGAGKTTLINVLSGFQRPMTGVVFSRGTELTNLGPHLRARLGVVRTFQSVRLFGSLSVIDNILAGALACGHSRSAAAPLVQEVIHWLDLDDYAEMRSNSLPYGLERRVGLARALALRPSFLLLDEPAAGLNSDERDALLTSIGNVRDRLGCGVLLVEHNMDIVFRLCSRVQVLTTGSTLVIGAPSEVRHHPEVRRAYLGEDAS